MPVVSRLQLSPGAGGVAGGELGTGTPTPAGLTTGSTAMLQLPKYVSLATNVPLRIVPGANLPQLPAPLLQVGVGRNAGFRLFRACHVQILNIWVAEPAAQEGGSAGSPA